MTQVIFAIFVICVWGSLCACQAESRDAPHFITFRSGWVNAVCAKSWRNPDNHAMQKHLVALECCKSAPESIVGLGKPV